MPRNDLIQFKIPSEIKSRLEQVARKKGLTLAAYIRMVLIESLQKE